ncbi:MAG: glycosyltransferase family 4 protein [Deltaproteobacteria bacterium]|nr:glycosyltransferase family 4 protein [Deltaproteobacteria bacterium]
MHVLFLTDNFPPEVNAPASRTFEHCCEWVKRGHRVTVVTCAPNFPKGKVFPGYQNRLWQTEEMNGIRVLRVWSYISANEGFARRILDYTSFMLTASLAAPFVRDVDVVIGTSPQFFTAVAAWFVGRVKRRPFVFELRDLWPESIRAVGAMKHEAALDLIEKLELFLYRQSAAVVSVTHSFKDNLMARGISGEKIAVVTNGVDLSRFHPRPKDAELEERFQLNGRFVAGYIGTHGMAHALDTLLDAAAELETEGGSVPFSLLFLGDGADKARLIEKARSLGLRHVHFIDTVPKDQVARYWSLLDASIIHLKRTPLFETVIPSKLFECMGMGLPVVLGVAGETARIVQREGVGLVFEPESVAGLVAALRQLRDDPELLAGCRARCVEAARRYDRRALAEAMLETVLDQAGHRRSSPV